MGSLAIQIAKADGARVTAVDRTEKLPMMRSLGADRQVAVVVHDDVSDLAGGSYIDPRLDHKVERDRLKPAPQVSPRERDVARGAAWQGLASPTAADRRAWGRDRSLSASAARPARAGAGPPTGSAGAAGAIGRT